MWTEEDSYAQAFNMLSGDSRSGWDECVMSDPRAIHLWDEKRLASRAFAGEVEGAAPPAWDAYLLYGHETAWGDEPPRSNCSGLHGLRGSGRAREEHPTPFGVTHRRHGG